MLNTPVEPNVQYEFVYVSGYMCEYESGYVLKYVSESMFPKVWFRKYVSESMFPKVCFSV